MSSNSRKPDGLLIQYGGFALQLIVLLALSAWGGRELDERSSAQRPLFVWIIPMIVLLGMMIKVIRDTSKKK